MTKEQLKNKIKYYFDLSQTDAINKYYYLSLSQLFLDIYRGFINND